MAEHSSNLRFPLWQPQYQAALIELNHGKLLERIRDLREASITRGDTEL